MVGLTFGDMDGIGDIFGDVLGDGLAVGVTVGDNFNPASVRGESEAAKMPDNKNKPAPRIKTVFLYIQSLLIFINRNLKGTVTI